MDIEQALKWADTWGPITSCPPSGDNEALIALAAEVRRLHKDSERLEFLMRNVSGKEFRRLGIVYGGNCGRDRIDAAMDMTSNAALTGDGQKT